MRRLTTLSRTLERGQRGQSALSRARISRPPSEPSCSRWLSCTCCREKDRHAGAAPSLGPTPAPGPSPFRLSETQAPNAAIPPISTLQRMQMPHLPLPPPLPWSPDSAPFLRHIQILSLALLSTSADESWEVYEGLHPDMRPLIPDDVFISLLAHQLRAKKRFARVLELLKIGRRCDMNPRAFARPTLEGIIANLLRRLQTGNYSDECADVLDWLWPTLIQLNNNSLSGLSLDIRKRWLNYMIIRHQGHSETVFAALEDVIEQGGSAGMAPACSHVVAMYRGSDPALHRTSFRLAAWCLARDIDIRETDLRTIVMRLNGSLIKAGEDGVKGVYAAASSLISELVAGEAHDPAQRLRVVLDWFLASQRTATDKAAELARDPTATMPKVYRAAERLLKRDNLGDSDLAAIVSLCLRALKFKDADYESLLRLAIRRLSQEDASADHIVRLTGGIVESGILNTDILSPQLITRIFYAVSNTIPTNTSAYNLAYHLYPSIRESTNPDFPHIWQKSATKLWLIVFKHAVSSGHLHFASRLYADFQADGQAVPKSAQLSLIRKIAETQSHSRRVLLDRHIKDYLWDAQAPTEPLVVELCRGLSKSPDDAALAIYLCGRIQPKSPLPPAAVSLLVTPLLTSAREERRKQGLALLTLLPTGEESRVAYHAALTALRHSIAANGTEELLRVYQTMQQRGLESSGETASLFIAAFLRANDVKVAKAIFDAAAKDRREIHPAAVSTLMIKLAASGRVDAARNVESTWRAIVYQSKSEPEEIGMVFGARLFVDIKDGKSVDLRHFVDSNGALLEVDGWKPTPSFFRWLEKVQHEQRGTMSSLLSNRTAVSSAASSASASVSAAGAKAPVSGDRATKGETVRTGTSTSATCESTEDSDSVGPAGPEAGSIPEVAGATQKQKQPVQPVTQSFSSEGTQGRWSVDTAGAGSNGNNSNRRADMSGKDGVVSFA